MRKTRWLNVSFAENLKISRCIGRRDYDTAIQLIRRGLNNSTQDAQGLDMIAMCHCSAGQDDAAIRAADQALAYNPQCFGAIQTLVRVYVKRQQHDMAARYLRRGLEHFPAPLPEPPRVIFLIHRLIKLIVPKYKPALDVAEMTLRNINGSRNEWYAWALAYLAWYDRTHDDHQSVTIH